MIKTMKRSINFIKIQILIQKFSYLLHSVPPPPYILTLVFLSRPQLKTNLHVLLSLDFNFGVLKSHNTLGG